jgi:hypothetical protein
MDINNQKSEFITNEKKLENNSLSFVVLSFHYSFSFPVLINQRYTQNISEFYR